MFFQTSVKKIVPPPRLPANIRIIPREKTRHLIGWWKVGVSYGSLVSVITLWWIILMTNEVRRVYRGTLLRLSQRETKKQQYLWASPILNSAAKCSEVQAFPTRAVVRWFTNRVCLVFSSRAHSHFTHTASLNQHWHCRIHCIGQTQLKGTKCKIFWVKISKSHQNNVVCFVDLWTCIIQDVFENAILTRTRTVWRHTGVTLTFYLFRTMETPNTITGFIHDEEKTVTFIDRKLSIVM